MAEFRNRHPIRHLRSAAHRPLTETAHTGYIRGPHENRNFVGAAIRFITLTTGLSTDPPHRWNVELDGFHSVIRA